jgi:hypothetical protein
MTVRSFANIVVSVCTARMFIKGVVTETIKRGGSGLLRNEGQKNEDRMIPLQKSDAGGMQSC